MLTICGNTVARRVVVLLLLILLVVQQAWSQDREQRRSTLLQQRIAERTAAAKMKHSSVQVTASEADSLVLVTLYNFSGGASWFDNTGWLQAPVSQWHGIALNSNGRVMSIDLGDNGLSGLLPTPLGTLEELEELDLSFNDLSFSIPASVANLTVLRELILWGNKLSGAIPPELGQMPALEKLSLFLNQLTGPIPPELGDISTLKWLYLDFNQLEGAIPAELANITGLEELFVDGNNFVGELPLELTTFPSLISLYAGFNQLTGSIPIELASMSTLQNLSLEGNQHTGAIPSELTQGPGLTKIYLANNRLTGEIPEGFGSMFFLTTLDLEGNELTGSPPPDLGSSPHLRLLNLSNNQLTGEVARLPGSLDELHLRGNQLAGDFASFVEPLTWLRKIDIRGNAFTGTLENMYGHQRLVEVRLSDNKLSGSFMPHRRAMYYLEILDLAKNKFDEMTDLTEWAFLDTVDVSENQLDFRDLVQNAGLADNSIFVYAPQDSLPTQVRRTDSEVVFSVTDSADGNEYRWFRNGEVISGADSISIRVDASESVARYYCEVTNDALPYLTLVSTIKTTDATPTRSTPVPEGRVQITVGKNYPNPFGISTTIPFSLVEPGLVRVVVYDLLGREVLTLTEKMFSAGEHVVRLDAASLSQGVYTYVISAGNVQIGHSMVVSR
ncbi:MAG: T9SS type A sorting domain-containing protein [Bacteroidota bacterium]|nr:T9SS type A sorting domain-containing protein [Bacteroidota bacterium]